MYKLEPIALTVENENNYKVRFKTEVGEVEYRFTANEKGFLSIGCEVPFARITNGDSAVPVLTQAIANFHQARQSSNLKAMALIAQGQDSFKIRFQNDTDEVEYAFTIENFDAVKFDRSRTIQSLGDSVKTDDSLEAINGDTAVDRLKRAICYFHEARHFQYEPEIEESHDS